MSLLSFALKIFKQSNWVRSISLLSHKLGKNFPEFSLTISKTNALKMSWWFFCFLNLAVAVGLHLRPPVEQNFVEVTLLLGLDQRGAVLVGNLDLVILKLLELPDVVELHVTDLPDLFGRKHVLLVLLTLAVRPEK